MKSSIVLRNQFRFCFVLVGLLGGSNISLSYGAPRLSVPPSYVDSSGKNRVFVDITSATYLVSWDSASQLLNAESRIEFKQSEAGYPTLTFPKNKGNLGTAMWNGTEGPWDGLMLPLGSHVFTSVNKITGSGQLSNSGFGFYLDDLSGEFMDAYMPSNREYDTFTQVFEIDLSAITQEKKLFTTCQKEEMGKNKWKVVCPNHFTTSSPLIFIENSSVTFAASTYRTLSGREIPVEIVGSSANTCLDTTKKNIANLEKHFGEWPHARILVRAAGWGGGMEYSGGFVGNCNGYVGVHELAHNFFARGLMPANGDAGWVDEAIATWVHNNLPGQANVPPTLTQRGQRMADRDPYLTATHQGAYSQGFQVMSYLHGTLSPKLPNGLIGVLSQILKKHLNSGPYGAHEFQGWIEAETSMNFSELFNNSVYGSHLSQSESGQMSQPWMIGPSLEDQGFTTVRHLGRDEQQVQLE